jgi:hypothetical protein
MEDQVMAIEIDEKIVAIWYLRTLPDQDWMAGLRELEPNQKYSFTYRFRYYKDDKAFDSKDVKNWYEGTVNSTRNEAIEAFRFLGKTMEVMATDKLYEFINDGDLENFR